MNTLVKALPSCTIQWYLLLSGIMVLLVACGRNTAGSLSQSPLASLAHVAAPDSPDAPKPNESNVQQPAPIASSSDSCTASHAPGGFRDPLPPAQVWDPDGPKRVGLQAGHWLTEEVPAELSRLQHGTSGGGKQEWELTLDLAQRTAGLLEAAGIEVDILPSTVPPRYKAHAFLSIHADGDTAGRLRGFKISRPGFSSIPATDDRFVNTLHRAYGSATMLPRDDDHITVRMLYYYAFNSRRYCHAVAPGVPQANIEAGFLTNATDRQVLLGNPDLAAKGIADGILAFLNEATHS